MHNQVITTHIIEMNILKNGIGLVIFMSKK